MPAPRNRRHLVVPGPPSTDAYRPHGRPINPKPFPRPGDRPAHAKALTEALRQAEEEASQRRATTSITVHGAEPGLYIQFESPPGIELRLESLEDRGKGIELTAVQVVPSQPEGSEVQLATEVMYDQCRTLLEENTEA